MRELKKKTLINWKHTEKKSKWIKVKVIEVFRILTGINIDKVLES